MGPAPTVNRRARFGVFEVDLQGFELRKHGIRIKLAAQPFQVLTLLLESGGAVVTREELRQRLWPNEPWGEHDQRLNNIINKIREAIGDAAENPRFVETLPRVGYRFLADVEFTAGAAKAPDSAAPQIQPEPLTQPELRPVPLERHRPSALLWTAFAGTTVIVALLAWAALRTGSAASTPTRAALAKAMPLTTYVGSELYPALSPDASHVVFAWDEESPQRFHIYTVPVSGGTPSQLTFDTASDSSPVWSPDGRQIAFLRESGPGGADLWLIGADGQNTRKLRNIRTSQAGQALAWTHDPNWLIVSQTLAGKSSHGLFLISCIDGKEFQLSTPGTERSAGDLNPAISPDGNSLAFTRSTSSAWSDVFVAPLSLADRRLGEPIRLTDAHEIIEHLAWLPDGSAILFSGATTTAGARHLFRVKAMPSSGAAKSHEVSDLGIEGDYPTIGGTPWKLTFVRKNIEQSTVWRLDLTQGLDQPKSYRMLSSTRRDYTTDLSPDGVRLVFSSVRSGPTEIWMSETNGSNLKRLTSIGGATPRWSPDGKQIAFESNHRGQSDIYVLTPTTGELRRLTGEVATSKRPSWSRDGRFVYFSSDKTGKMQIWKVPSEGGDAVQITRSGGMYAVETFDGKSIYFTSADVPADIWTTSSNGGDEVRVIRHVVGFPTIAMSKDGLYYLSHMSVSGASLDFYRFSDGKTIPLAKIDRPVHRYLSSSPDGKSVLYSQVDRRDSDLMMIDEFR